MLTAHARLISPIAFANLNKTFSLYEMGVASIIRDCGNSRGKTRKGKSLMFHEFPSKKWCEQNRSTALPRIVALKER
jgi:hypothetical protein